MKKDYPLTIGTQTYQLRFNFDALTAVEDLTNKPFSQVFNGSIAGSMRDTKTLFVCGLKHNHPSLTSEDLAAILEDLEDLADFHKVLIVALAESFPAKKKDLPNPANQ
jgi:hypothetical protein